jgi:RNA polymerase primary sigma factor
MTRSGRLEIIRFERRGARHTARKVTMGNPAHRKVPTSVRRVDESALVLAAQQDAGAPRSALVERFLPLIADVARSYRGTPGVERGELMQEGVAGLLCALQRYDADLGTPFWAYACWWVRRAMQQAVRELTRPVVLSDRAARELARVNNARRDHLRVQRREPTAGDLASATAISSGQVERLLAAEHRARGLASLGELVADPGAEEAIERVAGRLTAEQLEPLLAELQDREREILCAHYGLHAPARTLRQIGRSLGLTSERVRQIERRALDKLHEGAAAIGRPVA